LADTLEGENFNKFIVIKDSTKGPQLTWVEIGVSDLSNVEIIKGLNKEVSMSTPTMSLRTRKDIYSAANILNIPKNNVDIFLKDKVKGENFNKFIVIKDSKNGPQLAWVQIGVSDLANVEVIDGLASGDIVYILPSKSLFDYQKRFKERVNASFSFG